MFDWDGTVVDSMGIQEECWRASARSAGVDSVAEGVLVKNLRAGRAGEHMFDGLGYLPAATRVGLRSVKDRLWEERRPEALPFPGAVEGLRAIAGRCRVGIATCSPRAHVEHRLSVAGITHCVVAITTDAEARHPKPHPAMLLDLLRILDVVPERSLMVGDAESDRKMASAAGVAFLHLDTVSPREDVSPESAGCWNELTCRVLAGCRDRRP